MFASTEKGQVIQKYVESTCRKTKFTRENSLTPEMANLIKCKNTSKKIIMIIYKYRNVKIKLNYNSLSTIESTNKIVNKGVP